MQTNNINVVEEVLKTISKGEAPKKIGIDVHGVITKYPQFFSTKIKELMDRGHEVHIVTGARLSSFFIQNLLNLNIQWSSIFSIVSYHEAIGTEVTYDERWRPWMDELSWTKTKGLYAKNVGLDLHIDDSEIYGEFFDDKTKYLLLK